MYSENPERTQVIVGSMNMGYISDTARNRTHNLFRPKREPIPLGHSERTADVFGIADEHGFAIHGYADYMQIYDHCVVNEMHHLTSRLVDCIGSIGVWMTNNRLKLNSSKTEFIWFGSARRLAKCTFESDRDK